MFAYKMDREEILQWSTLQYFTHSTNVAATDRVVFSESYPNIKMAKQNIHPVILRLLSVAVSKRINCGDMSEMVEGKKIEKEKKNDPKFDTLMPFYPDSIKRTARNKKNVHQV